MPVNQKKKNPKKLIDLRIVHKFKALLVPCQEKIIVLTYVNLNALEITGDSQRP